MATKTLSITEEAYEKLRAQKRSDESFTDTITRVLSEVESDWRVGFGRYTNENSEEFETIAAESKRGTAVSMNDNTENALEAMGFELDEDGNVCSELDESR